MSAGNLAKAQAKIRARTLNVFVSYSTDDLPGVRALLERVTIPGIRIFIAADAVPPGARLTPAIEREIKACDLFVVMWSARAASSKWVPPEIGVAVGAARKILPVMLELGVALPPLLADIKYITASQSIELAAAQLRGVMLQDLGQKRAAQQGDDFLALTMVVLGLAAVVGTKGK